MRIALLAVVLALLAIFTAMNWGAFAVPTELTLGFTAFRAPVGLVLLTIVGVFCVTLFVYVVLWQASYLLEARRHAKALEQQRVLAEDAESSRITELRTALLAELGQLSGRVTASETALRAELQESANSLAAMLAEIDDRLRRAAGGGDQAA